MRSVVALHHPYFEQTALRKEMFKMIQLELFEPQIIQSARLVAAESPRQAFYNLYLQVHRSAYCILKESGAGDKVYDTRSWSFESLEAAQKEFERRVRQKTNPARRGRKYRLAGRDQRPNPSLSRKRCS